MNPHTASFIKLMKHPVKFRMFLFTKLPSAYFAGVRVKEADEKHCAVTVPYKWFSKNPFRSTYFACLSMAAEMSTGALAMAHLYKINPPVSMLVLKVESEYFKKATGLTTFVCEDGGHIQKAVEETIAIGEARIVRAKSVGRNKGGEVVAEFFITWSFKSKASIKKAI
jgi:phage terminase large subunit-like protein